MARNGVAILREIALVRGSLVAEDIKRRMIAQLEEELQYLVLHEKLMLKENPPKVEKKS